MQSILQSCHPIHETLEGHQDSSDTQGQAFDNYARHSLGYDSVITISNTVRASVMYVRSHGRPQPDLAAPVNGA